MKMLTAFWTLLLFLLTQIGNPDEKKVSLVYKAQKGQTMTYKITGNFQMEAGGTPVSVEMNITTRETITDVSPSGEITREGKTEEYLLTINGQKMPTPEEALKTKEISVIKPNGTLVGWKIEGREENPAERLLQIRLEQPFRIIFPSQPVGVGDKWSHEFQEDLGKGTVAAAAEYEILGFEKIKEVETVKIKVGYQEKGSENRKMTVTGVAWVEELSGGLVITDYKLEKVPFGPPDQPIPPVSGTLRIERLSGSPLGNTSAGQPAASEKKEKTIEEVVKDYEKLEGIFTIYRKKEAGKDTLYMEIKEDQLDKLLLLQVTASTGTAFSIVAGDPIADIVFKFVRRDEQILFVVPNLKFYADPQSPIARAVKRSFADAYLEVFKIEAKSPERKSVLINITDFFRSDVAMITFWVSLASGGTYTIDREKTFYNTLKVFPTNMVIQTAYHLTRSLAPAGPLSSPLLQQLWTTPLADLRSLPLVVNYNLFFLPQNNYRPRLADPRVGYFVTDYQDFTEDKEEQTKRYIYRWHLEKADPKAKLSPPKEPIVFWLDNAIPVEYRAAVKRGILLWNKAFERIGFKDAIVVKQMPDDADWDHADMRYNVIRWVTSPTSGYAVALFRVNPLTGQILNASITVDANMTRYTKIEFKQMVDPLIGLTEESEKPRSFNPYRCSYAQEALPNAWLGYTAMSLLASPRGTKIPEKKYLEDFLTEVVAHEMGHILGLRHNFIASTFHNLQELGDGQRVRLLGTTASVMDYNPFNLMALHSPNNEYWTTTIPPYDQWAIEYGYTPLPASSPEEEKPRLRILASKCNFPGHAYQSDEVADQFDPLVSRFDLAKDPLAYWSLMLQDLRRLLQELPRRVPEPGEHYWKLTRYFNALLSQYFWAGWKISSYIGGLHIRGNHRGDYSEKPPLTPVRAETQRKALELLKDYIFSKNAFRLPKSVYLKLSPNPYPNWTDFLTGNLRQDAPVRDTLSRYQQIILNRLFNPQTLSRVVNNEFKVEENQATLDLPTLFKTVTDTVWEELQTAEPVHSLRRLLQRTHLRIMINLLLKPSPGTPEDAQMLARYHLRQIKTRLQQTLPKVREEYTRIHYTEALDQVSKALEAKINITP